MRKTLQDVAGYLKEIMVPETHEAYAVNPVYTAVTEEEAIRGGVPAFRAFLSRLYDALYAEGGGYDTCKKANHEYENRTTLSVYYPFLHNVSVLLMRAGYNGSIEHGNTLSCPGGAVFDKKLSTAKSLACLNFLAGCGVGVDGIDLTDKKQDLSHAGTLEITYPDDPAMLTGLKVLAIAQLEHGTLLNQDVFLRCDYRALKRDETDVRSIVQDTVRALPAQVRDFALHLHDRYVEQGLSCTVETKGFHIYIKYGWRRKDVWGINASLNNGYHINVKPTRTDEYAGTVLALSPALQALIAAGYGCGRKREVGHCDGGCRGLPIPLDDSILEIRDDIEAWFDREVACLQRK